MKTNNVLITLLSLDEALKGQVGSLLCEVLVVDDLTSFTDKELLLHGEKVGRIYAYLEVLQILQTDIDSI